MRRREGPPRSHLRPLAGLGALAGMVTAAGPSSLWLRRFLLFRRRRWFRLGRRGADFLRTFCGIIPQVITDCFLVNPEHLRRLAVANLSPLFGELLARSLRTVSLHKVFAKRQAAN